jgi:hypothetical protein
MINPGSGTVYMAFFYKLEDKIDPQLQEKVKKFSVMKCCGVFSFEG